MKLFRGIIRLLILLGVTAAFCLLFITGRALLAIWPKRRLSWRNWNFRSWARFVVVLLKIRVAVTNSAPSTPFLLVCNHLSYIDIVVLASQLDCTFIAKKEVSCWPVIGRVAGWINTIFINRNRKREVIQAMKATRGLIGSGLGVVLFAEGTSTSGQHVSPFKSAMLEFAARQNVPVHYASLSYATNVDETSADQSVCWWGDMTFSDHFFRLLQLSSFDAQLKFGQQPIVAHDRRLLAAKLWLAVNALFNPVPLHR